jgi:hypothetical protein
MLRLRTGHRIGRLSVARVQTFASVLALLALLVLAGAPTALTQGDEVARIDTPVTGASIVGVTEIRGRAMTANSAAFSFYRLHYGAGSAPSSFRPIGSPVEQPVESGLLGVWDTAPLIPGEYTVQLTVYDTSGSTTTARVLVNVLPAPTPTPLSQPSVRVPVPGETPTPEDEMGPTPTPLPVIPPLIPEIPQIDTSPINPGLPIQPVEGPNPSNPGFQPIPINPANPAAPPSFDPGAPPPGAPPSFDPGQPSSQPINPISPINPVNAPSAPGPPAIAPYEPPPTLPLPAIPTPTIFGL